MMQVKTGGRARRASPGRQSASRAASASRPASASVGAPRFAFAVVVFVFVSCVVMRLLLRSRLWLRLRIESFGRLAQTRRAPPPPPPPPYSSWRTIFFLRACLGFTDPGALCAMALRSLRFSAFIMVRRSLAVL